MRLGVLQQAGQGGCPGGPAGFEEAVPGLTGVGQAVPEVIGQGLPAGVDQVALAQGRGAVQVPGQFPVHHQDGRPSSWRTWRAPL